MARGSVLCAYSTQPLAILKAQPWKLSQPLVTELRATMYTLTGSNTLYMYHLQVYSSQQRTIPHRNVIAKQLYMLLSAACTT